MNVRNKTKDEVINELQKLQQEYDLLKSSYTKDITERKRAAEALYQSEERYRNLFETASDSIFIVDQTTGNIINAYPAASRLYGYSTEEFMHIKSRDISAEPEKTEAAVREGITQVPLRLHRRKDGTIFPVEITGSFYTKGERKMHTAFIRDITRRRQAESSLKQALEWQEAIFEGSRDAIFISDQDSRFVAVNKAACDLTGYSHKQLHKMRIPDIHDLPDLDAYKIYHQRIFGGEEILSEAKILRRDGTKTDTEFNNRCVEIAGKLYMHTTARNVTERRQAEAMIRILARFPSENPDPVLRIDLSGLLLYANEACNKLLTWKLQIGEKTPSFLQKIIAETIKEGVQKYYWTSTKPDWMMKEKGFAG